MEPADAFYSDLAEGPENAAAWRVEAADGVALRVVTWAAGASGTVLFFPGRNEHAEKYGRAAGAMAARGYSSAVIDWRGQGLSERAEGAGNAGHIDDFHEYQRDVAAYISAVRAVDLPAPFFLIAHSMGGAIGLRALYEGLPVAAAAFSAPMWGILMSPVLRPVASAVAAASRTAGLGQFSVPVGQRESYVLATGFDSNALTSDPEMWAYMSAQAERDERLALGRPTMTWLHEALQEIRALPDLPPPPVPAYTAIAGEETIVDNRAIRQLVAHWPEVEIEEYDGARHEIIMEVAPVRERFFDTVTALFRAAVA